MALIKESRISSVKIRRDLMDQNFPSIWVEYEAKNKKLTLISGNRAWWLRGLIDNVQTQSLCLPLRRGFDPRDRKVVYIYTRITK